PRYYENFLYIKNSSNSTYKGTIFLTLYNNNNDKFNIKVLENVEVAAKTTQQSIDDEEENDILDEWKQCSLKIKKQIKTFDNFVTIYNNNKYKFNIKVLENVEVPAKTTQQLIDDEEENDMLDEWNQYSFKTKQQVKTFDSIVSNN